jgi:hypothetical protein
MAIFVSKPFRKGSVQGPLVSSQRRVAMREVAVKGFHHEIITVPSVDRYQIVDITKDVQDIITREGINHGGLFEFCVLERPLRLKSKKVRMLLLIQGS